MSSEQKSARHWYCRLGIHKWEFREIHHVGGRFERVDEWITVIIERCGWLRDHRETANMP
jgi:hypothetical protein